MSEDRNGRTGQNWRAHASNKVATCLRRGCHGTMRHPTQPLSPHSEQTPPSRDRQWPCSSRIPSVESILPAMTGKLTLHCLLCRFLIVNAYSPFSVSSVQPRGVKFMMSYYPDIYPAIFPSTTTLNLGAEFPWLLDIVGSIGHRFGSSNGLDRLSA